MAEPVNISLYQGHATPQNIILRPTAGGPFEPASIGLPPAGLPNRGWLNSFVALNLLVTTLAVVAPEQAPFNQSDMSLPRVAARALSLSTHLQSTDLGNLRPDLSPFYETDWPLVPKSAPRALALATHIQQTDLGNLQPSVNPFIPRQWPLVPAAIRSLSLNTHLEPTDLLTLRPDVGPFTQVNWQLPKAGAKPVPDTLQSGLLQTTLQAIVAAPFVQTDWPTPKVTVRAANDLGINLLQTTLDTVAVQAPFAQFDWALPQYAARSTSLLTHLRSTDLGNLLPDGGVVQPPIDLPSSISRASGASKSRRNKTIQRLAAYPLYNETYFFSHTATIGFDPVDIDFDLLITAGFLREK